MQYHAVAVCLIGNGFRMFFFSLLEHELVRNGFQIDFKLISRHFNTFQ